MASSTRSSSLPMQLFGRFDHDEILPRHLRRSKLDPGGFAPADPLRLRRHKRAWIFAEVVFLLLRREGQHSPFGVRIPQRREDPPVRAKVRVIHMRRLDGALQFQRDAAELVRAQHAHLPPPEKKGEAHRTTKGPASGERIGRMKSSRNMALPPVVSILLAVFSVQGGATIAKGL